MAKITLNSAANSLDRIRNNRSELHFDLLMQQSEVDTIGKWLAKQKYSKLVGKLLTECHSLYTRIERQISEQTEADAADKSSSQKYGY